jgi:hypothetical protein
MSERFTEALRAASEPAWSDAVGHRFVKELCAGAVHRSGGINDSWEIHGCNRLSGQGGDGRLRGTDRRYGAGGEEWQLRRCI